MPRTWKPQDDHAGWLSAAEFFALSDQIVALIEAANSDPMPRFTIDYEGGGDFKTESDVEARAAFGDAEPGEIKEFDLTHGVLGLTEGLVVLVRCHKWTGDPITFVQVTGTDRTKVEGLFVQVNESVERRLTKARETENLKPAPLPEPAPVPEPAPAPKPLPIPSQAAEVSSKASNGWLHNPWTVTIVGGVIAAVVATLVLVLILGSD